MNNALAAANVAPSHYALWLGRWRAWIRRKIPRLVWIGDEIDVCVTITSHPLPQDLTFAAEGFAALADEYASREGRRDALGRAETALRDLGLSFDKGSGFDGRDWEWDWSLKGPIRVQFRARHKGDRISAAQRRSAIKVVET